MDDERLRQSIEAVKKLLDKAAADIKEAAALYVQMTRDDKDLTAKVLRMDPTLTAQDLAWFERVGLGEIPDSEILDRGLQIVERIQKIRLN